VDPALAALLQRLQPGQRIRITQTVRVGQKQWTTTVPGRFRGVNYLATGLATHRVKEDDIVVVAVHFTKDSGELSSITLDEHTKVESLET
jgi:azurin